MDLQLHDRVILVVGATGLLGSAIVRFLRREGAQVIAASRHPDAEGLVLDAADDASTTTAVASVLDRWGRLDGLVVAAAPPARTIPSDQGDRPDVVAAAFAGKALTFLRVVNAVMPAMLAAGYGRIVGISGQNASITGNIAASVRNASLIIEAKNLADAAAGTGVTVNVVSPGTVSETPSREVAPGKPGMTRPDDVASIVTFLVSPLAGSISGESVPVGHRVRGVITI